MSKATGLLHKIEEASSYKPGQMFIERLKKGERGNFGPQGTILYLISADKDGINLSANPNASPAEVLGVPSNEIDDELIQLHNFVSPGNFKPASK